MFFNSLYELLYLIFLIQLVLFNLFILIIIVYYLIFIFNFLFYKLYIKNQQKSTQYIIDSKKQDINDSIILSQKQVLDKQFNIYYQCFRCNNDKNINLFDPIELKYTCCNMNDCYIRFIKNAESSLCIECLRIAQELHYYKCINTGNEDYSIDTCKKNYSIKTCEGTVTIHDFIKNKKLGHMCKNHYYDDNNYYQ